jgi:hypothetical protein
MNLNLIALNNVQILSNLDLKKYYVDCKDKIFLEVMEYDNSNESFENIVELKSLEYVIYFSFHQLINMPMRELIEDYTRKDVLNMMDRGINSIYRLYGKDVFNDENERIYYILEDIDELIFKCKINLKNNYCKYKFLDMFDYLLTGFKVYKQRSITTLSYYNSIDDEPTVYPFKDLDDSDNDSVNNDNDSVNNDSDDDLNNDLDSDNDSDNDNDNDSDNKRRKLE